VLGYNPNDGLGFRLDSWGEDAKRLTKFIHVGRSCSVEGVLRYNTWKDGNGNDAFAYQVRIRSGLYQCFGKNKNLVEKEDGTPVSSGYTRTKPEEKTVAQAPSVDATPCSVEVDEIPF
jgi:single-stranded DNA-binding protein